MPRKRYVLTGSDCCDRVLPVLGRHACPWRIAKTGQFSAIFKI